MPRARCQHALALCLSLLAALLFTACTSDAAFRINPSLATSGSFGVARERLAATLPPLDHRSGMLQRHKLVLMALADGVPDAAQPAAEDVYQLIRTQGLNEGAEGAIFFLSEDAVRTWKGDPHEQAMALAHIAALDASQGDWDNARAAADAALFQSAIFPRRPVRRAAPLVARRRPSLPISSWATR